MAFQPYLFFSGATCREAMQHYQRVFGGELEIMINAEAPEGDRMPGAPDDAVMHASLQLPDGSLMASDDPTGDDGPKYGVAVYWGTTDVAEAERVFAGLAEGGEVHMPMEEVFWSPRFGHCRDRFGIQWMIAAEPADAG
jgi:PhnB protein